MCVSEELIKEEEKQKQWWLEYQVASSCRHLATMKQPLLAPKLTDIGYDIVPIPPKAYKEIFSAFIKNFKDTEREDILSKLPFVWQNANSKAALVRVAEDVVKSVAAELKPVLEKFCNRMLKFSGYDGFRENFEGDRVFKHVSDIGTEVVGALLQVDDELVSDTWDLEIIDSTGERVEQSLATGEMLMYESARMIVGRPKPFKGSTSADITFYFVPESGWGYVREQMDYVNVNSGFREPLGNLVTQLTDQKKEPVVHEEL